MGGDGDHQLLAEIIRELRNTGDSERYRRWRRDIDDGLCELHSDGSLRAAELKKIERAFELVDVMILLGAS